MNIAELHRALTDKGYEVSYEKLRRAWTGERTTEMEHTIIKWIADVTDAPLEYIVGDDGAEFPELTQGVQFSSECTDGTDGTDCPNYVDAKGKCVRIDHCPFVLKRVA